MKNESQQEAGITYVIMPIEILQNPELTPSEKILYCYLSLFKKQCCFQSNTGIAETTGLDESTVKRGIKKLVDIGYLYVEFLNNNSAMRRIYLILDNPDKLKYLASKGAFSGKMSQQNADPQPQPDDKHDEKPKPRSRPPKRSEFGTEEEFEKAFYAWTSKR